MHTQQQTCILHQRCFKSIQGRTCKDYLWIRHVQYMHMYAHVDTCLCIHNFNMDKDNGTIIKYR